jgi:hypothetical protein
VSRRVVPGLFLDGLHGRLAGCDGLLRLYFEHGPAAVGYGAVYSADSDGAAVTLATQAPTTTPTPTPEPTPAPLGATNAPSGAADGFAPTLRAVAFIAVLSAIMAL